VAEQQVESLSTLPGDVLTERYDNGRTGHATQAGLTPSSFADGQWRRLATLAVDGAVYAQPLYVQQQPMPDGATHNVVYIATAMNKLYAFDADTYALLWPTQAVPGTSLPGADLSDTTLIDPNTGLLHGCAAISPAYVAATGNQYGIGIQSTPVIDRSAGPHGYMYFTYRTATGSDATSAHQFMARADLSTGVVTQVDISNDLGQPVTGLRQRPSLLLVNGVIYLGFGSHCEELSDPGQVGPNGASYQYFGTLLAVDEVSLDVVGHFEAVPITGTTNGAGIWQASSGIAADSVGSLYFITANTNQSGPVQPSPTTVDNSFVRLAPQISPASGGGVAAVTFAAPNGQTGAADYFTPWRVEWQDRVDLDLGSAGVLVPPDAAQIVGGGKEGVLYVLNRSSLGGYDANHWTAADVPACATQTETGGVVMCDPSCYSPDSANPETAVAQKFQAATNIDCATPSLNKGAWAEWPHIHGTPVYGTAADKNEYIYLWPEKDHLKAFKREGTGALRFATTPIAANVTDPNGGMPGGMLTLSTDPSTSGAVLFASVPLQAQGNALRGALLAFDATPASDGTLHQIWANYEDAYFYPKFVPPTVADSKVFLATFSNEVFVYGHGTVPPVAAAKANLAAVLQNPSTSSVTAVVAQPTGTLDVLGEANGGAWSSLATLGTAGEFPSGGAVALDFQNGTQLDAFAVDDNGAMRVFWTAATGPATTWASATLTPAGIYPPGAPLATQHRGAELDVFGIDVAGQLYLLSVDGLGAWSGTPIAPPGVATFPQGAGVATGIQNGDQLDVFAVDTTGAPWVFGAADVANAAWSAWKITSQGIPPGARLATSAQGANQLDFFAIDQNGSLDVFWAGTGAWQQGVIPRVGEAPGVPGAPVATSLQGANQVDVFYVGQTGAVQIYWVPTGGAWTSAQLGLYATPGAPLAAVAQTLTNGAPAQIDLLVPTITGVYGEFLPPGGGAWQGPFRAL
jgi:hypothetical protein